MYEKMEVVEPVFFARRRFHRKGNSDKIIVNFSVFPGTVQYFRVELLPLVS